MEMNTTTKTNQSILDTCALYSIGGAHRDNIDPDTEVVEVEDSQCGWTTHLRHCKTLNDQIEASVDKSGRVHLATIKTATGWLCADCIDVEPLLPSAGERLGIRPTADGRGATTNKGIARPKDAASDKQMAFVESLMAERGLGDENPADYFFNSGNDLKHRDGTLTKKEASYVIDRLMSIPVTTVVGDTADDDKTIEQLMAESNLSEIVDECFGRPNTKFTPDEVTDHHRLFATGWALDYTGDFSFMVDMKAAAAKRGLLSAGQAKGVLNCFLAAIRRGEVDSPTGEEAPKKGPREPGFYIEDETGLMFRFQFNRNKTGSYAKVWNKDGATWEYEGNTDRAHRARPATYEEAKQFGKITGVCGCCARKLTKGISIEAGIGPVCSEKYFGIKLY